jgi:uncharacterized protein (DUF4415 family)
MRMNVGLDPNVALFPHHKDPGRSAIRPAQPYSDSTNSSYTQQLSALPCFTPEQFAQAVVRVGLKSPPRKQQITLRIDEDVLAWFRAQGPGYQTQINALLRAYVKARRSR